MRTWERSRTKTTKCGSCGELIDVNRPIQVIAVRDLQRKLLRCEGCASGPVDVDQLEAYDVAEEGKRVPIAPAPLTRVGQLTPLFDAKLAAAGKDE